MVQSKVKFVVKTFIIFNFYKYLHIQCLCNTIIKYLIQYWSNSWTVTFSYEQFYLDFTKWCCIQWEIKKGFAWSQLYWRKLQKLKKFDNTTEMWVNLSYIHHVIAYKYLMDCFNRQGRPHRLWVSLWRIKWTESHLKRYGINYLSF